MNVIAQHLGCSLNMVENRARALELPKKKKHPLRMDPASQQERGTSTRRSARIPKADSTHRRWTAPEDMVLRRHWKQLNAAELAKRLERTVPSVSHRLYRLGLNRPRTTTHRSWSDREDRILAKLYSTMTYPEIAIRLGRTVSSVASRAAHLGITKRSEQ